MGKHAWERMEGESARAFGAFEAYRRLGPGRTIEQAWREYWSHSRRRGPRPGNALPPRPSPHFSRWAVTWRWKHRALAWDEEQAEIARDQELDRELKARAAEHEEDLRQRKLCKEEARAARTLARRVLLRALQGIDGGQVDGMTVQEILPHAQRISTLLEVGQRLERLALGEPTDVTRQETGFSSRLEDKLLALLQHYVPAERWQELAQELASLEEEKRGDSNG